MIRILSDLHVYDGTSTILDPAQLVPLFEGVDHLIINGDCCDTQVGATPAQVDALLQFLRRQVPRLTLITGNHDPDISTLHELYWEQCGIWMTHGDVLFPDLAPWSMLRPELRRRIDRFDSLEPPAADPIARRLRLNRRVCLRLPKEHEPTRRDPWSRVRRTAGVVFHPHRVLAMLAAWRRAPRLAEHLAAAHRPAARLVITGHIHFPRVWRRGAHAVINTGSFSRPFGALAVDLADQKAVVRRVRRSGADFRPAAVVAEFPLAAPPPPG